MPHPLVLALYGSPSSAAAGARAVHAAGAPHDRISVITRNHDEDTALAEQLDATPGVELEDSRPAGRLGELSGYVLAAIALVLPGIGSIVAAGPLSAGLGEAAGHVAGSLASALAKAGVPQERAAEIERAVRDGAVLLGVHTHTAALPSIRAALQGTDSMGVETANWPQ